VLIACIIVILLLALFAAFVWVVVKLALLVFAATAVAVNLCALAGAAIGGTAGAATSLVAGIIGIVGLFWLLQRSPEPATASKGGAKSARPSERLGEHLSNSWFRQLTQSSCRWSTGGSARRGPLEAAPKRVQSGVWTADERGNQAQRCEERSSRQAPGEHDHHP
jgi:hypothetical protein